MMQASSNKPVATSTSSPRRSSTTGNVTSLPPPPPRPRDRGSGRDAIGRYVCTLYVLVRVVYSVAFTFSGLYACVSYLVSDDMARLAGAAHLQWDQRNASAALGDVVRRRWTAERQRQASLVDTQRHACAHYVDDLTAAVAGKLDDALATSRRVRRRYDVGGPSPTTTVTAVVELRLLDGLADYGRTLSDFKRRYRQRLAGDMAPSLRAFADYLSSVQASDWLGFALSLFNRSVDASGVEHLLFHGAGDQRFQTAVLAAPPPSADRTHGLNVSGTAADFASFIDIQEVDEIQLWSRQFWERSEPST